MTEMLYRVCPEEELPVPVVQCGQYPFKGCHKCLSVNPKTYKPEDLILHNVIDLGGILKTSKPKGIEFPNEPPEGTSQMAQPPGQMAPPPPTRIPSGGEECQPTRPFPLAVGFVVVGAAVITGGLIWALILRFMKG